MLHEKGNNNKDQIDTEHSIHRTFTRHVAYIKTIRIKFVNQYQEGIFWPVFELVEPSSLIFNLRDCHTSTPLYWIDFFPIFVFTDG